MNLHIDDVFTLNYLNYLGLLKAHQGYLHRRYPPLTL